MKLINDSLNKKNEKPINPISENQEFEEEEGQ